MTLFWAREAKTDRAAIYDYVETANLAAAIALDQLFSRRANQLVRHPMTGRPGRVSGTRERVLHKAYILIYDLAGDSIRILRILHVARQWPPPGSE